MREARLLPIEVRGEELKRPLTLSGRRAYLISLGDGSFVPMGWHIPGEMGGFWAPPLKVLNGFWACVGEGSWLMGDACKAAKVYPWLIRRRYEVKGMRLERADYIPKWEKALILTFNFKDVEPGTRFSVMFSFNLRPVWYSEEEDGKDLISYEESESLVRVRDERNSNWVSLLWSSRLPTAVELMTNPPFEEARGYLVELAYELEGEGSLKMIISATHLGLKGALLYLDKMSKTPLSKELRDRAREYLELARVNSLLTPSHAFNLAWYWSKVNLEWLTHYQPTMGLGVTAGHPDYPWFFGCDTAYITLGLLTSGMHEHAKSSLKLIGGYAAKADGRVPHEIVTNGRVYNPGDAEETPLFVRSVYLTYLWTGDRAFLEELYPICVAGIENYVLGELCKDRELPKGPGIIEDEERGKGFNLDVACYTYAALLSMASMSEEVGESGSRWRDLARRLKSAIESSFWDEEEGMYAERVVDGRRVFKGYWVALMPLEVKLSEEAKASRVFKRLEREYSGPYGLYLNAAKRKGFMPFINGLMAVAEFNYNRNLKGWRYLVKLLWSFGLRSPACFPEFYEEEGCYLQAWSSALFNYSLVCGLLMPTPDAGRRTLELSPWLPPQWRGFRLGRIKVGKSLLSVRVKRLGRGLSVRLKLDEGPPLTIKVSPVRMGLRGEEELLLLEGMEREVKLR